MNEEEKKLLLEWEMILRNITDFGMCQLPAHLYQLL